MSELHSLYEKVGEIAGGYKQLLASISNLTSTIEGLRRDMASVKSVNDLQTKVNELEGRLTTMERFKYAVVGAALAGGFGVGGLIHLFTKF